MILLTILASTLLRVSPILQQKSNYEQVVIHPDPNNGYEDYLRASDIVRGGDSNLYFSWTPRQLDELVAMSKTDKPPTESQLALARDLHSRDYLAVRQLASEKYAGALTLIRNGNQKRVWDPQDKVDQDTRFPEFSGFGAVAKLFVADAYIRYAQGDGKSGTADLLDALAFSRRSAVRATISELISLLGQGYVFDAFENHLSRISDKDALAIIKFVDSSLLEPEPYVTILAKGRDYHIQAVNDLLSTPAKVAKFGKAEPLGQYLSGASPRELQNIREGYAKVVQDFYGRQIARFGEDESSWADPVDTSFLNEELPSVSTTADAVAWLATMTLTDRLPAPIRILITRTKLRLLALHARIIDFRWRNNRLPVNLMEAMPERYIHDPVAKADFQYELTGDTYRLTSKGTPQTGPIDLHYRLPSVGNDEGPIPPDR